MPPPHSANLLDHLPFWIEGPGICSLQDLQSSQEAELIMAKSLASLLIHTYLNMQQSVILPGKTRKGCKELDVCALGKGRAFFHIRKVHIRKIDCETWSNSPWGFFWVFYLNCDSGFHFSPVFFCAGEGGFLQSAGICKLIWDPILIPALVVHWHFTSFTGICLCLECLCACMNVCME